MTIEELVAELGEMHIVMLELLAENLTRGLKKSEIEKLARVRYGKEINVSRELKFLEKRSLVKKEPGRYGHWHITEKGINVLRERDKERSRHLGTDAFEDEKHGMVFSGTVAASFPLKVEIDEECIKDSIPVRIYIPKRKDFAGRIYIDIRPKRERK